MGRQRRLSNNSNGNFFAAKRACREAFQQAEDKKNEEVQQRILEDRAHGFEPSAAGGKRKLIRHKKQQEITEHMPTTNKQLEADKELVIMPF